MYVELLAQLVGVVAADAFKVHCSQLGAATQDNLQKHLVVLYAAQQHLHILKDALVPQVVDCCGYLVSGHLDDIAHLQAGNKQNHSVVKLVFAVNGDASNLVCLGGQIVYIVFHLSAYHHLALRRNGGQQGKGKYGYESQYVSHWLFQSVV